MVRLVRLPMDEGMLPPSVVEPRLAKPSPWRRSVSSASKLPIPDGIMPFNCTLRHPVLNTDNVVTRFGTPEIPIHFQSVIALLLDQPGDDATLPPFVAVLVSAVCIDHRVSQLSLIHI